MTTRHAQNSEDGHQSVTRQTRFVVALAVGAASAVLTFAFLAAKPEIQGADFTYVWVAARALWAGHDPYAVVGPSNVPFGGRLYYPLTAAIVGLPLAGLPAWAGGVIIVGLGFGLLAYAITARSWWPLLMLASAPAYNVCHSVQWTALFMAAAFYSPLLGIVAGVKPNIALPMFAFQTTTRAAIIGVAGGLALLVASLVLRPTWPAHWLETMHTSPSAKQYGVPMLTLWGVPLVLAALRWRRPEARLLLAMALMPQTGFLYDQFPLFLIPASPIEMAIAVLLSYLVVLAPAVIHFDRTNIVTLSNAYMPLMAVGLYLPMLVMVLRRPNIGELPTWIERLLPRRLQSIEVRP